MKNIKYIHMYMKIVSSPAVVIGALRAVITQHVENEINFTAFTSNLSL